MHLGQVSSNVGFHVNKVVSVVRVASLSGGGSAGLRWAHAVSDKTLGQDLDVILILDVVVPLLNVVAALELGTVSGDEADVNILFFVVTVLVLVVVVVSVLLNLTGVLNQSASGFGVSRDVTGVGHDQREGENSNASEHVV